MSSSLKNIFYNALQLVTNQAFGLMIFLVLSRELSKPDFGILNWGLAILLFVFSILSGGLDKMIVKKIAAGKDQGKNASLYLRHVIISSFVFLCLLMILIFIFPSAFSDPMIFLLLAAGKILLFLSTPFKQVSIGLEKFKWLLHMSIYGNMVKGLGLLLFTIFHLLNLYNTVLIFLVGELTELLICIFISIWKLKIPLSGIFRTPGYRNLLRESLPQAGVEIFSASLSRMDWILIGVFLLAENVAEYSFAFKAFELSTLPLLALAPLLVPAFSKLFVNPDPVKENRLWSLLNIELFGACLVSLCLALAWTPLIDLITEGKYGAVNQKTILIFAVCMPLLYINNYLWSLHFSQHRTRMIFFIFGLSFLVNLVVDLFLIPAWGIEGAAIGYLAAIFTQTLFYCRNIERQRISSFSKTLTVCMGSALLSGFAAKQLISNDLVAVFSAAVFYLLMVFLFEPNLLTSILRWRSGVAVEATNKG